MATQEWMGLHDQTQQVLHGLESEINVMARKGGATNRQRRQIKQKCQSESATDLPGLLAHTLRSLAVFSSFFLSFPAPISSTSGDGYQRCFSSGKDIAEAEV